MITRKTRAFSFSIPSKEGSEYPVASTRYASIAPGGRALAHGSERTNSHHPSTIASSADQTQFSTKHIICVQAQHTSATRTYTRSKLTTAEPHSPAFRHARDEPSETPPPPLDTNTPQYTQGNLPISLSHPSTMEPRHSSRRPGTVHLEAPLSRI